MKKRLLVMSLLCMANVSFAQQSTPCLTCKIGIFDDINLSKNFGTWTAPGEKKFFLGILYDGSSGYDGLTGVEISVSGLPQPFLPPTFDFFGGIRIGDMIDTPADTTSPTATGGWNLVWDVCQTGNRALVEMTYVSFEDPPMGNDIVFRVHRRFPASDPEILGPFFTTCEAPIFPKVWTTGGCYVINPTVGVGQSVGNPPCTLWMAIDAVEQKTWSGVKALYRD